MVLRIGLGALELTGQCSRNLGSVRVFLLVRRELGGARGKHQLSREKRGSIAKRITGALHHVTPQRQVCAAANHRTHAKRQGTPQQGSALAGQETLDKHIANRAFHAKSLARRLTTQQHAPPIGNAARLPGLQQHGIHQLRAFFAEHNRHHHRTCNLGVLHVHAVQLSHRLREQRGPFQVPANRERRKAHRGHGSDSGHEGGCARHPADRGHVTQIVAFQAPQNLFGSFIRMCRPQTFHHRQR